jgi:phosphatidate cytidylyltransferase
VADDKRDGDDLFEDLDKFFAPIRDVDWESEEPAGESSEVPSEEHVAVRASEPAAPPPPAVSHPGPPPRTDAIGDDDDEDEDTSWYDTSVMEPIDDLLGEPVETPSEAEVEEAVVIDDSDREQPSTDQADLFDDLTGPVEVPEDAGFAPAPRLDDENVEVLVHGDEPSEDDLEAAAEHFAESVRSDEGTTPEEFGPAATDGGDLDEGASDVEEDILADLDEESGPRTVVVGSEGLGGPSWQEPASVEVGADIDRRGPGGERDVPAAFLTGVVLAGVALGSLLIGKGLFAIVAAGVVLIAQGELFGVMVKHHRLPATAIGLVTGALIMGGAYYHGEAGILAMFGLGLIATFLWFMAVPPTHRKDSLQNIGLTIMNVAYVPLLASYLIVTLVAFFPGSDGKALVVTVIGLTFVYDTAAFLVGSVWGGSFFQRPLAPNTSPKKSIEGLIGATLITVIVSMALVPSFVGPFEDRRVESLVLAIVVAFAATLGDLAESLIKRDLGIKDMGSILPGHGGVLDRIDSLLFVAPAAFLLFRVIFS